MPASIGVNLRVTGNCRQGGRKYMEDCFSVAYQQTEDEKDLEYAFFGIYDGHGGVEAATFAKEHLMETIIKHKNFWSDNDEDVLRAIKDGYIATHYAMWREQSKWPRTSSGLPSTAGTTASIAFIRRGKIYIGHVGDSGIVLGYQEPGSADWKAKSLTKDHKPENPEEMKRIESCGGKVVSKSGVPRVVWNRPKIGHQGPVRRSTPIDEIPFLAVARSLGDLWSYNSQINQFVVSPDPDCSVLEIDTNVHRCLIFGTDGLFNMLSSAAAVHIVQQAERHNESEALSDDCNKLWLNPSKLLVERALDRWHATRMRADNTSAVTLMLDPPGPPRAQVLKDRKKNLPESGLKIMTRYNNSNSQDAAADNQCSSKNVQTTDLNESVPGQTSAKPSAPEKVTENILVEEKAGKSEDNCSESLNNNTSVSCSDVTSNFPLKERNFQPKLRESTSFDPREPYRSSDVDKENNTQKSDDNTIQINEISSSNIEESVSDEDNRNDCNPQNNSRTNLRSSIKRQVKPEQEKRGLKRKLDGDGGAPQQRKSLRLSLTQKCLEERKGPAPCTVAEERLKKLAEEAEKTQQKNNPENATRKLSITQKILQNKKATMRKASLVKTQLSRKKLKVVLDTVISRTNKAAPKVIEKRLRNVKKSLRSREKKSQQRDGVDKIEEAKKCPKSGKAQTKKTVLPVKSGEKREKGETKKGKFPRHKKVLISGKLSNFKRQSVRNASQRLKNSTASKKAQSTNSGAITPHRSDQKVQKVVPNVSKSSGKEAPKLEKKPVESATVPSRTEKKITESLSRSLKTEKKQPPESPKAKLRVLNCIRETRRSPGIRAPSRSSSRAESAGNRNDAKENIKEVIPKSKGSSKQKSSKPQKNTFRQRIRDKSNTLKKSVLKKSR